MSAYLPEIIINAGIFSMFFALISTELMAASSLLFKYEESTKKVIPFIIPIWEITGTFFIFYAVNMESLIPSVLPFLAYAFIVYILIFLILYIGRNSAIIVAETIWKNKLISKKSLYRIYAIITYIIGAIIFVLYTALISGKGVNFNAQTFNLLKFVAYLPDDGFIIGSAILVFGLASVFYGLNVNRFLPLIVTVIGLIIAAVSFLKLNDIHNLYYLIIPVILTILAPVLYIIPSARKLISNKILFQTVIALATFFIIASLYPNMLGGTATITPLLNDSAMQIQTFYATVVGGIMLFILTYVFFKVAYFKNRSGEANLPEEVTQ